MVRLGETLSRGEIIEGFPGHPQEALFAKPAVSRETNTALGQHCFT